MNSCKAHVDRVWDEGEALGEGEGGTLQEKDRDTRRLAFKKVKNCRSRPQLGCAGRKQDELLLRAQIFSHTYKGISY